MGQLIAVIGASGVGKTALVRALARAYPFETRYESHMERPFQAHFKRDVRYALANQIDYLLLRAEQERELRASGGPGLLDGGLDLDFHGFTRLFHSRGLLSGAEFDLCHRFYTHTRELLPPPELFVRLCADELTIADRLASRDRINIASPADSLLFNAGLDEWLATVRSHNLLELNVSHETLTYERSVGLVLDKIQHLP
jgi:deoxyadenosine/deoxycytidine kinase